MGYARDRRKFARIATDQVISFSMVESADQLALGKDVSPGGIRFLAIGCELALGDTIRVTFNVGDHSVIAVGQVVWATEMDPITTDIGLEFVDIAPEALRLIEDTAELHPTV